MEHDLHAQDDTPGKASGFNSYLPCYAFVTFAKHHAVSQKDLALSTESPPVRAFCCLASRVRSTLEHFVSPLV